jgi:PAS domain S-box-containing protein
MGTTTTLPIEQNGRRPIERAGLEAAIEQAGEAIVITEIRGSIQYVNPAFTRMTGYSREEARERTRDLKSDATARTVRELWATIRRAEPARRTGQPGKDGSFYTEEMNIAPSGSERQNVNYIAIMRMLGRRAAEEAQRFLASIVEVRRTALSVTHGREIAL